MGEVKVSHLAPFPFALGGSSDAALVTRLTLSSFMLWIKVYLNSYVLLSINARHCQLVMVTRVHRVS